MGKEDRVAVAGGCLILVIWLASALLSLGLTGVFIWAIIELVQHFTS